MLIVRKNRLFMRRASDENMMANRIKGKKCGDFTT